MTLTPEEQAAAAAASAQDPGTAAPAAAAVANPPTPVQPAPAPSQGAPWSDALNQTFTDPGTRSQVDTFLHSQVQPHVTRLEQTSKPALELYKDFEDKPNETFVEIAGELYGDEAAKAIAEFLSSESEASNPPAGDTDPFTAQPTAPTQTQLPPEVQEIIAWRKDQQEEAAFNAEFERVKADNPDLVLDRDLYVPLVAKHGDFDAATTEYKDRFAGYAAYRAQQAEASATAGEGAGATGDPAPPTLGSEAAGGGAAPPVQEQYESVNDSIDAFFDEQRAAGQSAAPPVAGG